MVLTPHLNYLIVAFLGYGLSMSLSNHVNRSTIESMNLELERLHRENESLRKEVGDDKTLKSIVSELDDCLTLLMREIMDSDIHTIDGDLRDEINAICHKIVETIPKHLDIEQEETQLEGGEHLTDSLTPSESYENISDGMDE